MRKLKITALLIWISTMLYGQTVGEWLTQKSTQRRYLIQQIAALQIYTGYLSKGYSIVKNGLNTIQDLKKGNFNLHNDYFKSLLSVNPKIKRYSRIADIISIGIAAVKHVVGTIKKCKSTDQLSLLEINSITKTLNAALDDCSKCLDALMLLTTDDQLSMKDDERITAIDKLYIEMLENQRFIKSFGTAAIGLCRQREHEKKEIVISKKLNQIR